MNKLQYMALLGLVLGLASVFSLVEARKMEGYERLTTQNPLDDPNIFKVLGTTPFDKPYGWFAIVKGGKVREDNKVLAVRTGENELMFVTGNEQDPTTFMQLPKGIWQFAVVKGSGPVRIHPEGVPFRYDARKQIWVNSRNKEAIHGKKVYPNKFAKELIQGRAKEAVKNMEEEPTEVMTEEVMVQ